MNLISWNRWRLGNPRTIHNLCQMVKDKRPSILFLMETKLWSDKISFLRGKFRFDYVFLVDCVGQNGGLAMFWRVEVTL
jgi:hypothetical protein